MDHATATAYLERIGAEPTGPPDAASLAALTMQHLRTVPFENLSIHLAEPIALDEEALLDKIVKRRRGGFCYELNGSFALLLRHLGYEVAMLSAKVSGPDGFGPPFDHMALRVELDEPWLVDVGFGRFARRPLRMRERTTQYDVEGGVVLSDEPEGDLLVTMGGKPQYLLEQRPRGLDEFAPTCWWQQTWPTSHFRQSLTCSLPTETGRVTLSGRRLVVTDLEGGRSEQVLGKDVEVLRAYRDIFGIELAVVPDVNLPAASG
jgi:N-hydroxyarylamine O-acetyltransferase